MIAPFRAPSSKASLVAEGGGIRVVDAHRTELVLPATAEAPFSLRDLDSGLEWSVQRIGATHSSAAIVDDTVVYRHAYGEGDVAYVAVNGGTEDFVVLDASHDEGVMRYRVKLGPEVAGVRLGSGNVLEALDARGTPRLRMSGARVVDAAGAVPEVAVVVSECTLDTRDGLPFGRAPLPTIGRECLVTLRWSPGPLQHPIVIDPIWTPTKGLLSVARPGNSLATLPDGRVLVAGGSGCSAGALLSSAEVFDPATSTFAATAGSMAAARGGAYVAATTGGILLMEGTAPTNCSSLPAPLTSAELYDPTTAKFTTVGPLTTGRWGATAVGLADGRVLLIGGSPDDSTAKALKTTEIYSPATKTFSAGPSTSQPRFSASAARLSSGVVLVVGGYDPTNTGATAVSELFNPTTNTFSTTGALNVASNFGYSGVLGVIDSTHALWADDDNLAEVYSTTAGTFARIGKSPSGRYQHSAIPVGASVSLLVGGSGTSYGLFYPATSTFGTIGAPTGSVFGGNLAALPSLQGALSVPNASGISAPQQAYVFRLLAAGSVCTSSTECDGGGPCLDGICCGGPCAGTCMTCSAALKGTGADGVCGPVATGTHASTCAGSTCTSNVQTNPQVCDATQHCVSGGTTACTPFACSGTVCATSCTTDAQCATSEYCSGSACVAAHASGTACTRGAECQSGECVDGVCCATACAGACLACSAAKKGEGADGVCGAIAGGTDPDAECVADSGFPTSCLSDGLCDGAGACRAFAPTSTSCGSASCTAGILSAKQCDGAGHCNLQATTCTGNQCAADGTSCQTSCTNDADCGATGYCTSIGTCALKQANGAPCNGAGQCSSGTCADGACCNTLCAGACEACAEPGSLGTCIPVVGAPRGARPACNGDPSVCGGTCDGVVTGTCNYAASTKSCGSSCEAGRSTTKKCDGQGTCAAAGSVACDPYVCDATACKETCTADADCSTGYKCDSASSHCTPAVGACSGDLSQSVGPSGSIACAPFTCDPATGSCRTGCASTDQCAAGSTCDGAKCVETSTGGGGNTGSGGGCAYGDAGRGAGCSVLFGAMAVFALRLRRRRSGREGAAR